MWEERFQFDSTKHTVIHQAEYSSIDYRADSAIQLK
jgi:hypothetical protein